MKSIFSDSALARIGKIKKGFLWGAVCLLIGGFSFGGVILLMNAFYVETGKVFGTIAILILVLLVGVNNFIRMEKGTRPIQILALVGLITGILAF